MNVSKISLLAQCYETMRAHALVTTKAEFSTRWLGRQPSYLTSMAAKQRTPSASVISYFADRLQAKAVTYGAVLASQHAHMFRARYDALVQVLNSVEQLQLWDALDAHDRDTETRFRQEKLRIARLRGTPVCLPSIRR